MKNSKKRGWIALTMLLGLSVLVLSTMGVLMMSTQSMHRAERDSRAVVAFQTAQAALESTLSKAFAALPTNNRGFVEGTDYATEVLAGLGGDLSALVEVQPTSDPRTAWFTSTVEYNSVESSVRVYVDSRNVGIWNNAIFAGAGAAGQAINGNVDIRGSVHILGEGEPYSDLNGNGVWDAAEPYTDQNNNGAWDPGEPFTDINGDSVRNPAETYNDLNRNGQYDPPLTQTDLNTTLSGTAYIGNHYSGMPAELEAMVPDAPRVSGIETLSAEVRVKHGRISISGNAKVGTSAIVDGGSSKGTIDGSYVSDGYTGSAGAGAVFSDNGASNVYDLGNLGIQFPVVAGIGAQTYIDSSQNSWQTQEHFLEARSLTVPLTEIKAGTAAFSFGPDAYGNRISFAPEVKQNNKVVQPAMLNVSGVIRFAGNLQIGGSKETIRYTGNGTLYSRESVSISANFLPASGTVFPTTARIGVIALRDLNLATGNGDAQLSMAGAFYAQGKIVSRKQNQIAGTFVAAYYDMGTNVPNIYQVPPLVYNMPPAMPGDKNYFSLRVRTWRDRPVTTGTNMTGS
ncbi:MAG: hypothetical protein L6Q31_11015 [Fimbriimonadaceae bacterium]|nr:hypothetical protein [Fimbriimonadaceae bacterium]NUM39239.1 hypothetical protein [Armatimonadota bacterium]